MPAALGSLPCAMLGVQAMRDELVFIRSHTDRPYNVNFFCHVPPAPDAARAAAWAGTLAPYYREFGVAPEQFSAAAGREPFSAEAAELLAEFRPRVVSFHFGLPASGLLAQVRAFGAKVLCSATTLGEALWLQAQGVDAVIAQGLEAGGHRGHFRSHDLTEQLGTFALVRQLVRALKVPVIAAGGIADAEGVAAARALGAAGVQVGTAYLLCPEATTSALHRAALRSDAARHTVLTNVFTGRPARGIVNRVVRELGPISALRAGIPAARSAASRRCALRPRRRAAATSRRCGRGRTPAAAARCPPPT